jgi:putative Holliday junction resolvase
VSRILLGVDYGTVRVGLALAAEGMVVPLKALPHPGSEPALVEALVAAVAEHRAEAMILGLPLYLSGDESPISKRVSALTVGLRAAGITVHLQDERLTSHQAESDLRASGLRWFEVEKGHVDCVSAMAILRDYLDLQGEAPTLSEPPELPPEPPSRRDRRRGHRKRKRS